MGSGAPLHIGVISDTHGLLRPSVLERFAGVHRILHAGDVGNPDILTQLETVAPVTAVCGNVDGFPLRERLPESRTLELGEIQAFLTHIGGRPAEMRALYPEIQGAGLVVFGHSHQPHQERHGPTLFFNPGSAGPRRFSLPVTVGLVEVQGSEVAAELIHLPDR